MNTSKVVALLFIGLVAGVLIAPSKGTKTRKKLSRLFNDVSDSMQDVIEVFRDREPEAEIAVNQIASHQQL